MTELSSGRRILDHARQLLLAGQIDDANGVVWQALAAQPGDAQALNLSGLIAFQQGRAEQAADLLRKAVEADGTQASFLYNLGVACQALGKHNEAVDAYRRAIAIEPRAPVALNNLGYALLRSGCAEEATRTLEKAIALAPDYAEAYNNLGLALCERGNHRRATAIYRRAIELKPDLAEVYFNLSLSLAALRQYDEALSAVRRAIQLRPNYAEARHQLLSLLKQTRNEEDVTAWLREEFESRPDDALLAAELGNTCVAFHRWDEAVHWYQQAIQLAPEMAELHNNLGHALTQLGKVAAAEEALHEAIRLSPSLPEAHNNLGKILLDRRDFVQAAVEFEEAIRSDPDHAEAHNNLGSALKELGRHVDAVREYNDALRCRPDWAVVHNNLGNALTEMERPAEAAAAYRAALLQEPTDGVVHSNLANALTLLGHPDESEAECRLAVKLSPHYADAHHNRSIALMALGRVNEALSANEAALAAKPDYPEARLCRAFAWLSQGDFERGWEEYEWRWKQKKATRQSFPQPFWQGEPLEGRTVLLQSEQGFGDTFQFIRYARLVRERGGRVIVECQDALTRILSRTPGIDELVPRGAALPKFDVHLPLLSVPRVLHTTLDTIPAEVPYIFPDEWLVERWRDELSNYPGFKIGIAWQGRTSFAGDRLRSVPLKHFEALARLPGVTLFSLQKGAGQEQLAEMCGAFPLVNLADRLDVAAGAFMDTAAVMRSVDLVVTSDTAIAHLAGAMAVPTWVVLGLGPDWRWLQGQSESPWYPTMRVFQQRRLQDWDDVFKRVADEICKRSRSVAGGPSMPASDHRPGTTAVAPLTSPTAQATVSIITPWRDHPELIADYERAVRGAEVIVVDNGSQSGAAAEIRAMVERLGGIYLRNDENAGFALANNQGLARARGDIVVFLNSDVAAHGDFLAAVRRDVVGNMLVGPASASQLVYGIFVSYLEGWCLAGRREVFERLGGWDAVAFAQPFWEDNDLCLRAIEAGIDLRQAAWPIVHKVGKTRGDVARWGEVFERNRATFAERVRPLYLRKRAEAEAAAAQANEPVCPEPARAGDPESDSAPRLNLSCVISSLGYGVVGLNALKALARAGVSVACWPEGSLDPPPEDMAIVRTAIARQHRQRESAPSLRIYHQFRLKEHHGRPRIGFPIFELDRFTNEEIDHLRSQDLLLVASHWASQVVERNAVYNGSDRVRVVPLGVDRTIFCESPSSEENHSWRATTVFLAVGKWERRKGHDMLLEAFTKAFTPEDDVELRMLAFNPVITSTAEHAAAVNAEWETLYRNSPLAAKIRLLPRLATQHEVADAMRQADCGVFLSRSEGWNLPALEMLSCGKQVIITNYSGHTEYCDSSNAHLVNIDTLEDAHDGRWFFGQGQWAALGERQLDQAIEHLRAVHRTRQEGRLGVNQAGIETAKRFTWDSCATRILDVVHEVEARV